MHYFFKILLIGVLSSLFCLNTKAQVTIGSQINPNKGALLDLKQEDKQDGSSNSKKGLLLPRVKLIKLTTSNNDLRETIEDADKVEGEVWGKEDHLGLVVYNVNTSPNACVNGTDPGVYTWSGDKWVLLSSNSKPQRPPLGEGTGTDKYKGANTYILQKGESVNIPIQRAFQIWKDFTGTDKATGKVLNPTSVFGSGFPNGTLSAEVVWQETDNAGATGVLSSTTISVNQTATIENSTFNVTAGSQVGNALVAVKLNGKVLWQWQIWVPATDPEIKVYPYDTGKDVYWFMDRYLGAIDTVRVKYDPNINTTSNPIGTFYQWGRPTPMKRFGVTTSFAAPTGNEQLSLYKAIQSPDFIWTGGDRNGTTNDWYSNSVLWETRWGDGTTDDKGNKTAFDPCPEGWRVPAHKNGLSPWECLKLSQKLDYKEYWGFNFTDPGRELGYYPATGYRYYANGDRIFDYKSSTEIQRVWSASAVGKYGYALLFYAGYINPSHDYLRADGNVVRCVQDYQ